MSPRNGLEDTEEVLRSFLDELLGYHEAASVEIQRVHRLGKKKDDGGARPILEESLQKFTSAKTLLQQRKPTRSGPFSQKQQCRCNEA